MSSKYHWTQELTNPQDRFRLYQHTCSNHYRAGISRGKPLRKITEYHEVVTKFETDPIQPLEIFLYLMQLLLGLNNLHNGPLTNDHNGFVRIAMNLAIRILPLETVLRDCLLLRCP